MKAHFFCIPAFNPHTKEEELNAFLQQHPGAMIERHFIADGANSAWAVCCTITNSTFPDTAKKTASAQGSQGKHRIDYREILSPEHFARFAILREVRNNLAKEQGVPPYAIFSNQQLAEVAQLKTLDSSSIAAISGVGRKRVERYAVVLIDALKDL